MNIRTRAIDYQRSVDNVCYLNIGEDRLAIILMGTGEYRIFSTHFLWSLHKYRLLSCRLEASVQEECFLALSLINKVEQAKVVRLRCSIQGAFPILAVILHEHLSNPYCFLSRPERSESNPDAVISPCPHLKVSGWRREELGFSISFLASDIKLYLVGSDMEYEGGGEFAQVDQLLSGQVTGNLDYLLGKRIVTIEEDAIVGRSERNMEDYLGGSSFFHLHIKEGNRKSIFTVIFHYKDHDYYYTGFPEVWWQRETLIPELIEQEMS